MLFLDTHGSSVLNVSHYLRLTPFDLWRLFQLAQFRHLKRHANDDEKGEDSDDDDGVIADNYRPPMPTGERAVRSCNAAVKFVKKQ